MLDGVAFPSKAPVHRLGYSWMSSWWLWPWVLVTSLHSYVICVPSWGRRVLWHLPILGTYSLANIVLCSVAVGFPWKWYGNFNWVKCHTLPVDWTQTYSTFCGHCCLSCLFNLQGQSVNFPWDCASYVEAPLKLLIFEVALSWIFAWK